MNCKDLKVGDKVYVACMNGHGTGGETRVIKIKTKYNEGTGKPYPVIICGDGEYNSLTGNATTPPLMYYISHKVDK